VIPFPQVFPPKPCTHLSPPHLSYMPAHLILLDFNTCTIVGKEYSSRSLPLWSFLHSPVTLSLLGPNILNTLFSIKSYYPGLGNTNVSSTWHFCRL
jgi:hypothetical protein